MHLKDLNIDIPYRATNATYSKRSSDFSVKRMESILPFKMSEFSFAISSIAKKKNISYTRITFS